MKTTTILFFSLAILAFSMSCKRESKVKEDDDALFQEAQNPGSYIYYKNDPAVQTSSPESAHNDFFRVRFNAAAVTALTDSGRLPLGGVFPDGSVVVKELFDSQNGELKLLAVMKKSAAAYSANGWQWAEYKPNGDVQYSLSEVGGACTSCHSSDGRDYVRLFNLFP